MIFICRLNEKTVIVYIYHKVNDYCIFLPVCRHVRVSVVNIEIKKKKIMEKCSF